ncbi:MAG: glycosyltransferase family 4 protein [Cyclobacteriaceae bacterium]|nr:glycosyltransferase family 4 protein [Cyclobacteriaceae bacterium]
MRIFADVHVFDGLGQGSKTYLKGLYSAALQMDLKDYFYFGAVNNPFPKELNYHGNAFHLRYHSSNRLARLTWEMPTLLRANKIDIAHFQYISPIVKVCQEIATIHDVLFLDFPEYFPCQYRVSRGFFFKRTAKRADFVLTVSEFSKKALIQHFRIDEKKVIVTPNGVLDLFWSPLIPDSSIGIDKGLGRYILYVSRFEPRKNQCGLLRAYLELELWKKEYQLVFVGGKGILDVEFETLYHKLDEKKRGLIYILDEVAFEDLKWLYSNCSLFIYPSFAEGFGIPPLEAIACGANTLCSNTSAMSEFTFLGERLFNPNERNEMNEKIRHFLENPSFPEIEQTKNIVKSRYSWESSANNFLSIINAKS